MAQTKTEHVQQIDEAADVVLTFVEQQATELRRVRAELAEALDVTECFLLDHDNGLGPSVDRLRNLLAKHGMAEARCAFCGKGGLSEEVDGRDANAHARCR